MSMLRFRQWKRIILPFLLLLGSIYHFIEGVDDTKQPTFECPTTLHNDFIRPSQFNRYLHGFTQPVAIINQLYSLYSLIPISLILNSTLIMGDMCSGGVVKMVYTNYKFHPMPYFHIGKRKRVPVPFEHFFNFSFFQDYWSNQLAKDRRIRIFPLKQFDQCMTNSLVTNSYTINNVYLKSPKPSSPLLLFLNEKEKSVQKKQLLQLLDHTETKQLKGKDQNIQQSNDLMLLFNKQKQMGTMNYEVTMYEFLRPQAKFNGLYAFGKHPELLIKVIESLRPTTAIKQLLDPIIDSILPSNFITMVLRLDIDYEQQHNELLSKPNNESKVEQLLFLLNNDPCTARYVIGKEKTLPPLFLLTNTPVQTKAEVQRYDYIVNILKEFGFTIIETKKTLLLKVYQYYLLPLLHEKNEKIDFLHSMIDSQYFQLTYEQLSLLEIFIGFHSACFIPSIVPSPKSYFIQRLIPFYQAPKMLHMKEKRREKPNQFHKQDAWKDVTGEKYGPSIAFQSLGI